MKIIKEIKKLPVIINNGFIDVLEEEIIPQIIEIIMNDYDFSLNNIADPKSALAPERFMDEFRRRLVDFNFVYRIDKRVKIVCPDMKNFNFSGGLEIIETIVEGVVGRYVEITGEDYFAVSNKKSYRGKHISKKEVFVVKYTSQVRGWETSLGKKFDYFPFSNRPPANIFARAEEFVKENLENWTDKVINKSVKTLRG